MMITRALLRLNKAYNSKGNDINRVNLTRHNTEDVRDTLQLIVFFIGVFDKQYRGR